MPDTVVNQDHTVGVLFEDVAGPITGLTDVLLTAKPVTSGLADLVTAVVCVETPAGSGYYEYTIPSTKFPAPMRYQGDFSSKRGGADVELFARRYYSVGYLRPDMRTRRQLRYAVARHLYKQSQRWLLQATGGSTTTATLPAIQVGGSFQLRGLWARFSDGANRGEARLITNFDETTKIITVAPALPAAVAANHWVEIYPDDAAELDAALDNALADLAGKFTIHAEETLLDTDGTTEFFALPADARWVYEVGALHDTSGTLTWLPPSSWTLHPQRRIRILTPRLRGFALAVDNTVANPFRWPILSQRPWPDGYKFRLKMLVDAPPPLYDESLCDAPALPLIDLAVAVAMNERGTADAASIRTRLLTYWQARSSLARRMLTTPPPAGARRVLD